MVDPKRWAIEKKENENTHFYKVSYDESAGKELMNITLPTARSWVDNKSDGENSTFGMGDFQGKGKYRPGEEQMGNIRPPLRIMSVGLRALMVYTEDMDL